MAPRLQAQAITLPPVGVHTGAQVLAFVGTNPTDRPLSFADSQQGRRRYATGGLALSPYVPRRGAAAMCAHGNVGCRTNAEGGTVVRLRTIIRSRWHLSQLFSRFIGEPRF
jgi:hypothetical protein